MSRRAPKQPSGAAIVQALEAAGADLGAAGRRALKHVKRTCTAAEQAAAIVATAGTAEEPSVLAPARRIVAAGLMAADIDPGLEDPPPEFCARFESQDEAMKAWRMAKAAWLPTRLAPHVFSLAQGVVNNDVRLKAAREAPPATMNVAIQMNLGAGPVYEEIEVDE